MLSIENKILTFKEQILACEKKYARKPGSVVLLAASKGQSINKIEQAITGGQFIFGENYLQEALIKITSLNTSPQTKECKKLEWHFIGTIQRNKTKKIAENFDWVQSVADISIAKRLNEQRPSNLGPLNICLEVNISEEKTKSGLPISAILQLTEACLSLPNLRLRGLMAIPRLQEKLSEQRLEYNKIKNVYDMLLEKGYPLDTLSIGMSNDWEAAIAEGATMIRIGTAIFGARN